MPYVQRQSGHVVGVFANLQPGFAEEFLADDHADVVAFRSPSKITPEANGAALTERQRTAAKAEAAALASAGDYGAAITKLMELI